MFDASLDHQIIDSLTICKHSVAFSVCLMFPWTIKLQIGPVWGPLWTHMADSRVPCNTLGAVTRHMDEAFKCTGAIKIEQPSAANCVILAGALLARTGGPLLARTGGPY